VLAFEECVQVRQREEQTAVAFLHSPLCAELEEACGSEIAVECKRLMNG
jgi:hypothetical protein